MVYKKITNKLPSLSNLLLAGILATSASCESCDKNSSSNVGSSQQIDDSIIKNSQELKSMAEFLLGSHQFKNIEEGLIAEIKRLHLNKDAELLKILGKVSKLNGETLQEQMCSTRQKIEDYPNHVILGGVPYIEGKIKHPEFLQGMDDEYLTEIKKVVGIKNKGAMGAQLFLHLLTPYNKVYEILSKFRDGKKAWSEVEIVIDEVLQTLEDDVKIVKATKVTDMSAELISQNIKSLISDEEKKVKFVVPNTGGVGKLSNEVNLTSLIFETGCFGLFDGLLKNGSTEVNLKLKNSTLSSLENKEEIKKGLKSVSYKAGFLKNARNKELSTEVSSVLDFLKENIDSDIKIVKGNFTETSTINNDDYALEGASKTILGFLKAIADKLKIIARDHYPSSAINLSDLVLNNDGQPALNLDFFRGFFESIKKKGGVRVKKMGEIKVEWKDIEEFAATSDASEEFKKMYEFFKLKDEAEKMKEKAASLSQGLEKKESSKTEGEEGANSGEAAAQEGEAAENPTKETPAAAGA